MATSAPASNPVVFIHGLWLHATSWRPWCERFEAAGRAAIAPGWPGEPDTVEAARAAPEAVADRSIDDVVGHVRAIVERLPASPILIGHSFGGLVAEKLLGVGIGRAAIAIDPAPMQGVLPLPLAQLRSAWPALANPLNLHRSVALTAEQFRFAFGNAIAAAESDALHARWSIPSPARPLFQAAVANVVPHSQAAVDVGNATRGPLLLISGTADHTVPDVSTAASFRRYRGSAAVTEMRRIEGRGHSLVIDSGWPDVADLCLGWLRAQGL